MRLINAAYHIRIYDPNNLCPSYVSLLHRLSLRRSTTSLLVSAMPRLASVFTASLLFLATSSPLVTCHLRTEGGGDRQLSQQQQQQQQSGGGYWGGSK